jgi:hypothetical protein
MTLHITAARPDVGRRLMEARTLEAVVVPAQRVAACRVAGILKRIR